MRSFNGFYLFGLLELEICVLLGEVIFLLLVALFF